MVSLHPHPGSGKTIAYLAPIIHHLREEEQNYGVVARLRRPRACIVVPGRELATQVLVGVARNLATSYSLLVTKN